MKKNADSPTWKEDSDEHDYPAALNYLSLICDSAVAKEIVSRLRETSISSHLAKDILRASRLPLLPQDNFHVKADLKKVKRGDLLSPVLLVRGNLLKDQPLAIADGYHRVCASYYLDENAKVLCHITGAEAGRAKKAAAK